ncbi:MAG: 30S ribosomal protein S4, partial [Rectinemataceae bacterium]
KALGLPGKTGDNLIILLERRLDNVVYRMHFAVSRAQARQLVNHGHIAVNGKRVNIASYLVRPGDTISVIGAARKMDAVRAALEEVQKSGVMPWIEVNADEMTGRYVMNPQRQDVTDLADVKEQMIVELYSK